MKQILILATLLYCSARALVAADSTPAASNVGNGAFSDPKSLNRKVKLFWLGAGTAEEQIHKNTATMHETLDKGGVKNVFFSSLGTDHEWQTWRRCLNDFVPRLFQD